jgi:hypothetical protein
MRTTISAMKLLIMTALLGVGVLSFNGCADYASVGLAYNDGYYVPDYRPFYAAYYYDGVPYWGPNYAYIRKKVVVKDVDKHVNVNRNVYYGGHHFVRDSGRPMARTNGFRRARRG